MDETRRSWRELYDEMFCDLSEARRQLAQEHEMAVHWRSCKDLAEAEVGRRIEQLAVTNEEMDGLVYDYNQLADTLCRTEDMRAEKERECEGWWRTEKRAAEEANEARGDLAEAASCVLLLLEYARWVYYRTDPPEIFDFMPGWMQREIEKG